MYVRLKLMINDHDYCKSHQLYSVVLTNHINSNLCVEFEFIALRFVKVIE